MRNEAELLVLAAPEVGLLLRPAEVLEAVREAFALHSQRVGRIFPVVRERLRQGAVFGIKTGDVEDQALLGFKAAGFWPANRAMGSEPHQATIMLIDPGTGRPTCLIDGNAITTARTGAAGALGLQYLARPDSERLCVFGTGVQARIQVKLALETMRCIREVRYVTANGTPDFSFEAILEGRCASIHATDPNEAAATSDVIVTATPASGPLFATEAVRPGTHLNCVGADTRGKRELPDGLLPRARVFADDRQQSQQIGEGQWYDKIDTTEIGNLVAGDMEYCRQEDEITVFDMTGFALQDLTVARLLYRRAMHERLGTRIPWPW
ncbi:ornithine cyclodeaminase family protein [Methylorubrum rhodesianum]|uniref:ornithine cyclodeaminase family protein n=1 Tax=Methylorubrum rhodesianum TaxID=29427 RepID=UPI003D050061